MFFFCDLRVLERKLASPFGHQTQVSTQVQLAVTCDYFQFRLARALLWIYHFIPSSYLVNISMTGVYSGIEYTIYKAPFDLPWEAQ